MKVIFKQILTNEKHQKLLDEINKNNNFMINEYNFTNFFDCNYVIDILKENLIDYKILLDDGWNPDKKIDYSIYGKIIINDVDYEKVKQFFKLEETINDSDLKNYISEENDTHSPIESYKDFSSPIKIIIYSSILIAIIILIIHKLI